MNDHTNLQKLQDKIGKLQQTPYIDKEAIDKVVGTFEKFVNGFDPNEMLLAAERIATDNYAKEMMAEMGITLPKDQDDAYNRVMAVMGHDLCCMHRTLQQSFMRIIITFIEVQAALYEAGIFDLRNEDTGRVCKLMWDSIKDRDDVYFRYV